MIDVLLPSVILIALGYAFHSLLVRVSKSQSRHVHGYGAKHLPVHRLSAPSSNSPSSSIWQLERHGITFSASTTALNALPKSIVDKRAGRIKPLLRALYDAGSALGLIGGLVGILGTVWALQEVWKAVWEEARLHASYEADESGPVKVLKRAIIESGAGGAVASAGASAGSSSGGLQPLLPGVTMPWSHLPTVILALVVNQLVHELGHMLSAATDDISPSRLSFDLHGIIPSMAVHFSSAVDSLPTRAKMRLASAGPTHNLITYGWLWMLAFTGFSKLFWADVGEYGRVVYSVNQFSSLAGHIEPGRFITHLDDVLIEGESDIWTEYLSGTSAGDKGKGWCIERNTWTECQKPGLADTPCDPDSGDIVFEAVAVNPAGSADRKCFHPHPILEILSTRSCPTRWVLVRPIAEEQILRIRLEDGTHDGEAVLWKGDRRAVLENVIVGRQEPRLLAPVVRWGTLYMAYMSTVALSLFLFNLLPLPNTDGSQLLRSFLSSYAPRTVPTISLRASLSSPATTPSRTGTPAIKIHFDPHEHEHERDAEAYELDTDDEMEDDDGDGHHTHEYSGGRREGLWKRRLRRGVEGVVLVLGVGWVAGWGMLLLLRSS